MAAGFNIEMASLALYKHGGNIYRAAEDLLNNNGIIDTESSGLSSEEGINCQNFFFSISVEFIQNKDFLRVFRQIRIEST